MIQGEHGDDAAKKGRDLSQIVTEPLASPRQMSGRSIFWPAVGFASANGIHNSQGKGCSLFLRTAKLKVYSHNLYT
jgi:hypothetical protein